MLKYQTFPTEEDPQTDGTVNFEIKLPLEQLYNGRYHNSSTTKNRKTDENSGKGDLVVIEPVCYDKMAQAYRDIKNILEEHLTVQQSGEFKL